MYKLFEGIPTKPILAIAPLVFIVSLGLYYHHPIEAWVLRQHVRDAREEAHLRGCEGEASDFQSQLRFSDPTDVRFGDLVEGEHQDDTESFEEFSSHGFVSIAGVIHIVSWLKLQNCKLSVSRQFPKATTRSSPWEAHFCRFTPASRLSRRQIGCSGTSTDPAWSGSGSGGR